MKLINKLLLLLLSCSPVYSYAQGNNEQTQNPAPCCVNGSCCDNNQIPAGIMTAHIHDKGKWMASYMYMNMLMKGNQTGTTNTSNDVLYKGYLMAPEKMVMQMHMVMAMYGITDRLTVMGMAGFAYNNMTMTTDKVLSCCPPGSNVMECTSAGLMDTKLYALYSIAQNTTHQLIGSMGVSLPTGTTEATGVTILGANERLSYNMQLGTGSYGILPGITFLSKGNVLSWGAALTADVKANKNSNGYKCGDVYTTTAWISREFLPFLSASVRAEGISAGSITGSDPSISFFYNLKGDQSTSAANYGGKWVITYISVNAHLNEGALKNFQLSLEYGMPVYQDLNGTQMTLRANFLAGLQYKF